MAKPLYKHYEQSTDSYIRDRVVQLEGRGMACTGIQIKAPSGKVYTLSANHCSALATDNMIHAKSEDGREKDLYIVDQDPEHDLLLLSSLDHKGIEVAKNIQNHEHVHTITHGAHFPSYRTDGELLEERTLHVHGENITNEEEFKKCSVSNFQRPTLDFDSFSLYCEITLTVEITTAMVVPGSSGGPAVDANGRLVGIVSCSAEPFSGLVPLHDIQAFLQTY